MRGREKIRIDAIFGDVGIKILWDDTEIRKLMDGNSIKHETIIPIRVRRKEEELVWVLERTLKQLDFFFQIVRAEVFGHDAREVDEVGQVICLRMILAEQVVVKDVADLDFLGVCGREVMKFVDKSG